MTIIERMQEFGIGKDDAKSFFAIIASCVGKKEFKASLHNLVIALVSKGMPIVNAHAFVNSLTVAQLMEAKEA